MKSRHKLFKNYNVHGKNCEVSGSYNFYTLRCFLKRMKNQDKCIKNALLHIQLVQYFAYDLRFKLSFIAVFFRIVHK